ncbi:AraC family transcriptional regulator [Granulosicoccus antarcticus]|uniref:HTH-type transcriptional activator Btr n=1 Tax=Granulosicoccus antarcticus IMCC3135 TaxID=1192854 RepID=A0A2Z2NV37_9GAMM|nr:AraC family transcriptional regulator [Granulosicoccus antarcticus]ASJ70984.1 HTH-type transcriptional activator Btr [Granulosicoccus antarcticus IMCC3135]
MPQICQPETLISPEELPIWVPGTVISSSQNLGWKEVSQCTYQYHGQDVEIPPMERFLVVRYHSGVTPMDRQFDGHWTRTKCQPGHFSLLSRAAASHWHWTDDVEVSHLYLSNELMSRVASDMLDKEVSEILLHDVLRGSDPVVNHIVDTMTLEARSQNQGNALCAEALGVQLAVYLLRSYANCIEKERPLSGQLSQAQVSRLQEYIDAHLQDTITLAELAAVLSLGIWTFGRQVQRTLGCTAQALVMKHRIERARTLLIKDQLALKQVAAVCGFSDQAHMTRSFRTHTGLTPGAFQKSGKRSQQPPS